MFGIFKKIGQRAEFEAEMIPAITSSGFPFERAFSIKEQGEHTDSILKILEDNGEPFNKYDFTAISYATLAFRCRDIGLDEMLNIACCSYIISNMKNLNSYSIGLLDVIQNAPNNQESEIPSKVNEQLANKNNTQENFGISKKIVQSQPDKAAISNSSKPPSNINIPQRNFRVNEKVVPKGEPTAVVPIKVSKSAVENFSEPTALNSLPTAIEEKKQPMGPVKCPGCKGEYKNYKLLKSGVGSGWKMCPSCGMNFQVLL